MTPRRPQHNTYTPAKVTDFTQLDAAIEQVIADAGLAKSTQATYRQAWARWTKHCAAMGVPALGAPLAAYTRLLSDPGPGGKQRSWAVIAELLNAVTHHHRQAGLMPAHKHPSNTDTWNQLTRGYRRTHPRNPTRAVPMPRGDLLRLLHAQPAATPQHTARKVAALLALDHDFTAADLARLQAEDIHDAGNDGNLDVAGTLAACDHEPRVAWLPWECTACAIRDLLDEHSGGQSLFKAGWPDRAEAYTGIAHLLRRYRDVVGWPGITKTPRVAGIRYTEGLDPEQVAGLRYGLVTAIGAHAGIRTLRTKAWLALSWAAGLRMGSDLAAVTRQDVTVTDAGITVALSATKDDPTAAKQVVLGLPWPDLDPDTDTGDLDLVNPTVLLYRWLAVRDAACGETGPLLPALGYVSTIPTNRPIARHRETAAADLRALTDLAGIDTKYTVHSARRGFASQAHRAGIPVEGISRALRHASPDPTLGYIDAGGPRQVATKLLAAADAAGEPVK